MTDPYLDPATGILRNKVGATTQDELDAAEIYVTAVRDASVAANPIPGAYDLSHLQDFNCQLFGDIYGWAGAIRRVNISKPGMQFCAAQFIESWASDELQPKIVRLDYLRGLDQGDAVLGLADLLGEINMLHSFPGGQRSNPARLPVADDGSGRVVPDVGPVGSRGKHSSQLRFNYRQSAITHRSIQASADSDSVIGGVVTLAPGRARISPARSRHEPMMGV